MSQVAELQYLRQCSLVVGNDGQGLELADLHVAFQTT